MFAASLILISVLQNAADSSVGSVGPSLDHAMISPLSSQLSSCSCEEAIASRFRKVEDNLPYSGCLMSLEWNAKINLISGRCRVRYEFSRALAFHFAETRRATIHRIASCIHPVDTHASIGTRIRARLRVGSEQSVCCLPCLIDAPSLMHRLGAEPYSHVMNPKAYLSQWMDLPSGMVPNIPNSPSPVTLATQSLFAIPSSSSTNRVLGARQDCEFGSFDDFWQPTTTLTIARGAVGLSGDCYDALARQVVEKLLSTSKGQTTSYVDFIDQTVLDVLKRAIADGQLPGASWHITGSPTKSERLQMLELSNSLFKKPPTQLLKDNFGEPPIPEFKTPLFLDSLFLTEFGLTQQACDQSCGH